MNILYDILFSLGLLIYLPVLLIRGKWHKEFFMRFGSISPALRDKTSAAPTIWFHAVSVGEVMAITHLIKKIHQDNPQHRLVLSTVTPTGQALARSRLRDICQAFYAPLDFGFAVRAYITAIRPRAYVSAETEIWPNLISHLTARSIPVVICNGRLTEESFRLYRRFAFLFRPVIEKMDAFCMQTEQDAGRIRALGAGPERISVTGNLKFDIVESGSDFRLSDIGFHENDQVWIAGSTHPGEEGIILSIYKRLLPKFPSLRLMIAPRHVERADGIARTIREHGFAMRLFSKRMAGPLTDDSVLIVDTIGDLRSLYPLARIVFMGKSLLGKGGQNILEPAFYGKAVIVGPNMQNFQSITDQLLKDGGLVQVNGKEELLSAVERLLANPDEAKRIGEKAHAMICRHQGATQRTADILQKFISL